MRGRHPKPDALKEAQGNPGRRRRAAQTPTPTAAQPVSASLPFARLSENARLAYQLIGTDLRTLNFVRSTAGPLLLRYCDTLARFWKVTGEIDSFGGEVYECDTQAGGKMLRMRPQFIVQQMLA